MSNWTIIRNWISSQKSQIQFNTKITKKTNAPYIIISIEQKSSKILTANSLNPFSDHGHYGLYTFIQNYIFNISHIVCVGGHLNVKSEISKRDHFFKSL